ncbi:substrate-binding periplasmic protein [Pelagibacterium luteolum]|uniref:Polar amino acid transport system substrate-binding protein n=1 Tax=Pelagibacterium luteolum TaxID=440168 RepID=A0A1G7WCT4_9HYPH|nr:transporter substrate-binding domain-containing protein [Pelagibacterium luteolum]SDG69768.1 polar amino acid transport system substrate-binding protein [Pelagibacterium luteolum]
MTRFRFGPALLVAFALAAGSATAQDRPFLYNEEDFGRPVDGTELDVCIDQRDPAWQIDEAIAREIAAVLLLDPQIHYVGGAAVTSPFDDVYYYLRAQCRVFFGFKLIAGHYPEWVAVTRAYYDANYVFVGSDPNVARLGDLPPRTAIGTTSATSADFLFLQFNNLQPTAQRWRRIPFGTDAQTLSALESGTIAAALVWGPSLLDLTDGDALPPDVQFIAPDPVQLSPMPVGGLLLSTDTYLRQEIDTAIVALQAQGYLDQLVAQYPFLSVPAAQ